MNCTYFRTCPSRIAFGETENGCNKADESTCSSASDFYRWYQEEHIERAPAKAGLWASLKRVLA